MLKINLTEHAMLEAAGALASDEYGNEILAGLTVAESEFVLKNEKEIASELPENARQQLLALSMQHRKARIVKAAESLKPVRPGNNFKVDGQT